MSDTKGTPHGPFAAAAKQLAGHGLAVIPCGKEDGKKPSVNWPKRPVKPDSPAIAAWIKRFGDANIGILTGLSGVTIVDIDDPTLTPAMIDRFGETPLQTRTPSGGTHLWYRSSGERCGHLRNEGLAVDIKAKGGFLVVPPSVRPTGPHAGKAYEFVVGDWDVLPLLPVLKPGSLPDKAPKGTRDVPLPVFAPAVEGVRNDTLFKTLKDDIAPTCESEADLIAAGRRINATYAPPDDDANVVKTARRVWRYKQEGRLLLPSGPATAVIDGDEYATLVDNPDALALVLALKLSLPEGTRGGPFSLATKAMARDQVIPGWGWRRYRAAIDWLVNVARWLVVVREGSTGKVGGTYEAWLYAVSLDPTTKGAFRVPNITIHPPPLASLPPPDQQQRSVTAGRQRHPKRTTDADTPDMFDIEEVIAMKAAQQPERPEQQSPADRLRGALAAHIARAPKGETKRIAERLGLSGSQISNFKAGRFGLNPPAAATLERYLSEARA